MALERELQAARRAAIEAAELAKQIYARGITAEAKPDESPVTIADRECERLLEQVLLSEFPEDGLLGEEGALRESRSGRRWIIDPIDGTRDFIRGNRHWAVLIGLEEDGRVLAGVCHMPGYGETYAAARGAGADCNGRRLQASSITDIRNAVVCLDGFNSLHASPIAEGLLAWLGQCWAVRSWGGAPDAMLVASGQADVWICMKAAPWDLAPMKVIAEEAGVRFLNLNGESSIYGGDCVLCVPALEEEVFRFLNSRVCEADA
jgi:fructose-1,6-bisphosphatase/inositol monophosphatase family enzyme